jgi:hypothetical protein
LNCKRFKANDCREHFQKHAEGHPIKKGRAFEWSVTSHNAVRKRQGKRELTMEEAYEIWGPDNIRIAPCSSDTAEPRKGNNPTFTRSYGQQPGYYAPEPPKSQVAPMTHFGPVALMNSMLSYHDAYKRK